MKFVKSRQTLRSECLICSEHYVCSGVTRYDCHVINSGVRRVSGKARLGSSESRGKSTVWEFGESREKPSSAVRIVSGIARQCR